MCEFMYSTAKMFPKKIYTVFNEVNSPENPQNDAHVVTGADSQLLVIMLPPQIAEDNATP